MITFHDGPASGSCLDLRRAPVFLRVVIDDDGTIDALDQLDDAPKATEQIYVYRLDGPPGQGFLCSRGKGCRTFVVADYRFWCKQPRDSEARTNAAWREWAALQAATK